MNFSINYSGLSPNTKGRRYTESVSKRGLLKNKEFLKRLYYRGKLRDSRSVELYHANDIQLNRLYLLMDCLEEMYPGQWDIHCHSNGHGAITMHFLLKFDQIHITNSRGEEHTIRDLMVVLPIKNTSSYGLIISGIRGFRTRLSYEEYLEGYQHSHLDYWEFVSPTSPFQCQSFCTGGAEIDEQLTKVKCDFTQENLRLFLIVIRSLVEWESIEGTPYIYMKNVINRTKAFNVMHYYDNEFESPSIPYTNVYGELSYTLFDGQVKLKDTDKFAEIYKQTLISAFERGNNRHCTHLGYKEETAEDTQWYYPSGNSIRQSVVEYDPPYYLQGEDEVPFMYFQGHKIWFEIDEPAEIEREINYQNLDVHPQILENGKKAIEERIMGQVEKANRVERIHRFKNAQERIKSNQVPV